LRPYSLACRRLAQQHPGMTPHPDPWPFHRLVLRTPRLELRPDDDVGLLELVEQVHRGVHPPERMPFLHAWTDAPEAERGRNTLQHNWAKRAELAGDNWTLNFLVRREGRVIGVQELAARDFPVLKEVSTGSWLGLEHQGLGFGTEMRQAALLFAFDHLGAELARSGAFSDNAPSLRVSRKLGYVDDGTARYAPRGVPAVEQRLRLEPGNFARPGWRLAVEGLAPCLPLLTGATTDK
jgi:RimJ/RimL family protein N-acetyltransferase